MDYPKKELPGSLKVASTSGSQLSERSLAKLRVLRSRMTIDTSALLSSFPGTLSVFDTSGNMGP